MIGVILLGQSNSGKSTLGKAVARRLGIRYISSGDIARSMNDASVQDDLNSGKMAPEDKMRSMILNEINSCDTSYILDGFPRFYDQYEWINQNIDHGLIYVNINVPYDDIISRATIRGRKDDDHINEKMKFFREMTEPMIREIIECGEQVYIVDNSNNASMQDSIDTLTKIVEEYLC